MSFDELTNAVNLEDFEREFAGEDIERLYAWNAYYLAPGLKSAWTSLGYPIPEP